MPALVMSIILLSGLVISDYASARDAEEVFRSATTYTVKIRGRITTAFIRDNKGSQKGAGFLVDADRGWLMTNAHVVGRSPAVIGVAFKNLPFVNARKIYVDPYLDLAVLEIDMSEIQGEFVAAPLNCDELPSVGHPVGAFGHPYGLDFTGTRGIVSGTSDDNQGRILQTDAAINPGNSGGPLISMESGKVVGINAARRAEKGDQNTNFAIPMVFACRVLKMLQRDQDPSPPNLPVIFLEPPLDREALIVGRSYLPDNTLALQPGDEIVGVERDSGAIIHEGDLIHALRGHLGNVRLRIKRDGSERVIQGRLAPSPLLTERAGILVSGILIGPNTLRDAMALGTNNGLLIHEVERGTAGQVLEFQPYDVVTTVDGKRYSDVETLFSYLQNAEAAGRPVTVEILRLSDTAMHFFDYMRRDVPIDSLELISGQ